MKPGTATWILALRTSGETVEKVPKQILGEGAEKNDFTESATINNLAIMRGRETPKNRALTLLKGFSTVSEDILGDEYADNTLCYLSVTIEGEDYGLKASNTGRAYRGASAFFVYPRSPRCYVLAGLVYPVFSCH